MEPIDDYISALGCYSLKSWFVTEFVEELIFILLT